MSKYTKADILQLMEEEDVEFVRLQFTDMFGMFKNVAITASQMEKALNNQCMFDGSSVDGFVRIEESDMFLHPDLDTFAIFPWRPQQGRVARLICDVYRSNGEPFEGDSRYILKQQVEKARKMGYEFNVGPECEFFLYHTDDDGLPTTLTHEKAGYFDMGPIDLGENARRDMILTLEDMGFEIEASHHEMAPAQHEIDFKYEDAVKTADNIMTFKLAVKTIAKRHGLHATFMPKPKVGVCGSGMHINMSLSKDGKNAFYDASDELGLSREAYYFIGGIMKHMKGMTAITNQLVNSYKRFVPGYEAPVMLAYSARNRSASIRIPVVSSPKARRIEVRFPDPAANPYLCFAALLMAGLDGIKNKIHPGEAMDKNLYDLPPEEAKEIPQVAGSLEEALNELDLDREFLKAGGVFTDEAIDAYIALRREEDDRVRMTPHPVEFELYYSV